MESLKEALPEGISASTASIPGYGMIAQLVLSFFGFDLGEIVSLYLLLFGGYQAGLYVWNRAWFYYKEGFTSTVRIDDDDDLYTQFIAWISAQQMTEVSRDLTASTLRSRAFDDDDESDVDDNEVLDDSGFFNFEKWSGTNPVYYEPNFGDDNFIHEGQSFEFSKDEKENKYNQRWEKFVVIRCMGRSTQPIKDLIEHVKDWYGTKENHTTKIYRSEPKQHGYGGGYWECQATRPSRPISTVSLDEEQKTKIVADINDYLMPRTSRWYAARGIPYLRGYLFHGPPGTGKTSLSFALAGIFGFNIYCASLSEADITEAELGRLFTQLPRRCVVLLEDIDSAGIRREEDLPSESPASESGATEDSVEDAPKEDHGHKNKSMFSRLLHTIGIRLWISPVPETTKPDEAADEDDSSKDSTKTPRGQRGKSNITLAGLLNIIDGAASHEGRVLIMTTNNPEKLDSALVRPGRVDLQIKFALATREQIRDIFKRMYSTEVDEKKRGNDKETDGKTEGTCQCALSAAKSTMNSMPSVAIPPARLAEMAEQFTNQIPECALSPAEIQGYLLINKTDAAGALAGVREWVVKLLEAKKKGKKVVEVQ